MPFTDQVSSITNCYRLIVSYIVRFPRPTPKRWVGRSMFQKGGYETVLVSACFRCSPMGEYDSYLEFYKDSIGSAELGVGKP